MPGSAVARKRAAKQTQIDELEARLVNATGKERLDLQNRLRALTSGVNEQSLLVGKHVMCMSFPYIFCHDTKAIYAIDTRDDEWSTNPWLAMNPSLVHQIYCVNPIDTICSDKHSVCTNYDLDFLVVTRDGSIYRKNYGADSVVLVVQNQFHVTTAHYSYPFLFIGHDDAKVAKYNVSETAVFVTELDYSIDNPGVEPVATIDALCYCDYSLYVSIRHAPFVIIELMNETKDVALVQARIQFKTSMHEFHGRGGRYVLQGYWDNTISARNVYNMYAKPKQIVIEGANWTEHIATQLNPKRVSSVFCIASCDMNPQKRTISVYNVETSKITQEVALQDATDTPIIDMCFVDEILYIVYEKDIQVLHVPN